MEAPEAKVPVFERGLWNRPWFMLLLCAVFVMLDWEMVPVWVFPFIFVFPVMLVAWNRSLLFAVLCAVVLSLTRMTHQYFFELHPSFLGELGDAMIRFFVLTLLATLTYQLGRQARQLRQRVRQLEGILPICAGCKSIRDKEGNWLPLEGYIMHHTPAQFSHGFCPDCFKDYCGDLAPVRNSGNE
jgi:hypothetical protein